MITIDEAIKVLTPITILLQDTGSTAECDALKLGIEALKRLRDHRNGFPIPASMLLIGETEK